MSTYKTLQKEIYGICFKETGYPHKWPKHSICPCCGSKLIRKSFYKYDICHWICARCSFVFVNPYPDEHTIRRLYNASYYTAVREHIEIPRALTNGKDTSLSVSDEYCHDIIDSILQKKKTGRWLDVGGGIGSFLNMVRAANSNFELFLNESNENAADFAREHYKLNVLLDSPKELKTSGYHFDVITFMSVIEHISHPIDFIKSYTDLLNPGGILLINIPRFSPLNRYFSRSASNNAVPPYHLSLFYEKNIIPALENLDLFSDITFWQQGENAFSLIDLMHVSEYFDVKVPQDDTTSPECFQSRPYTRLQIYCIDYLARINKRVQRLITAIDGSIFLNILAVKRR